MLLRSGTRIKEPPRETKHAVETEIETATSSETLEDSYVYVHCSFNNRGKDMLIRIWKTTFLIDSVSGAKSQLVHAENISYAPQWTLIPDGSKFPFLLIFSSLPRSCRQFDLIEEIDQPGGFHIRNIHRNETDVYHVDIL